MNREIKFRVWDSIDKMWQHKKGHLTVSFNSDGIFFPFGTGYGNFCYKDRFFIQQYTGLKDKNGVEIYEGDILDNWMWYSPRIVEFGNRLIYTGIESNGKYIYDLTVGFLLRSVKNKEMLDFYFSSKEVLLDTLTLTKTKIVGNIFENTELLKNHE